MTPIDKLQGHLGSWVKLSAFFQKSPSRADLLTLLDLETRDRGRSHIRERIAARLATVEKQMRMEGKL